MIIVVDINKISMKVLITKVFRIFLSMIEYKQRGNHRT